jgi:hypothetical protein
MTEGTITRLPGEKAIVELIEEGEPVVYLFSGSQLRHARQRARDYLESHPEPPPPPKAIGGRPTAAHPWRRGLGGMRHGTQPDLTRP